MGDVEQRADRWCILRTSGGRTLSVARSLAAAGFDVWTPTEIHVRRRPRSNLREERDVSIIPTFVFVRADRLDDIYRVLTLPVSPHPPFSVFTFDGRIPLIGDSGLGRLRAYERDRHLRYEAKKRGEQIRVKRTIPRGTPYTPAEGVLIGMTGVVEGSTDKEAEVYFGGSLRVQIETWRFPPDVS